MQTIVQFFIDKSKWTPGPWQSEPDKKQWMDQASGLACLIVRGPSGALCGYVGVPPGHPWFKLGYDDLPVSVHGGLTYASRCREDICHVVEEGEPDTVWWIGFDCAHSGDTTPGISAFLPDWTLENSVYRDFEWVEKEVENLAKQVAESTSAD